MKLISENKLSNNDIAGTAPSIAENQVPRFVTNFESFKADALRGNMDDVPQIQ